MPLNVNEAYVKLGCPDCEKHWEASLGDLPPHDTSYDCPGCTATRRLAEFARTGQDLATLKAL